MLSHTICSLNFCSPQPFEIMTPTLNTTGLGFRVGTAEGSRVNTSLDKMAAYTLLNYLVEKTSNLF